MSYFVTITDNMSKKVTLHFGSEKFCEFLWFEGNYSCDCNRHAFFDPDDDFDFPCGNTRYSISVTDFDNLRKKHG